MPRDICFIGQMEDGRLIIAYVPPMSETANASQFKVSYAIEKVGSDGTAYIYGGDLITIEKSALPVIGEPTDPDVFLTVLNGCCMYLLGRMLSVTRRHR
jgi:hypothetical protein